MPSPTAYARRKAAGRCVTALDHAPAAPGHMLCEACLEGMQARTPQAMHAAPRMLAHCGAWHPITTLPLRCPCCGQQWREEAPITTERSPVCP